MESDSRRLYHGTSLARLPAILANGLTSPSCWGTRPVALYYAEVTAEEEDSKPVLLAVPLTQFNLNQLRPDHNSIAEPLTMVLRSSEEVLNRQWEQAEGTWLDSLCVYGSVIYRGTTIPITASNVRPANSRE